LKEVVDGLADLDEEFEKIVDRVKRLIGTLERMARGMMERMARGGWGG